MVYLQRYSSFSLRNGKEISLPITRFSSSSLPSTEKLKSNYKRQAPSRSVGLLILEISLPLFNGHPNQFLPTNGKHPLSLFNVFGFQRFGFSCYSGQVNTVLVRRRKKEKVVPGNISLLLHSDVMYKTARQS